MIKIERTRYAVVTKDGEKIMCGQARNYRFKPINEIEDTSLKTYLSPAKAKSGVVNAFCWRGVDFDKKCKIIAVKESLEEVEDEEC